ncbi:MAG: tRNA pseudouridine(38-40) synthase TruA [Nocardioidaceae bacterium]
MRWRLDLCYDGTDFHGWAAQPGLRTVQGVLEDALHKVLRSSVAPATTCAGRTDAGVHARGQVVHVDVSDDASVDSARLLHRLARLLPGEVRVVRAQVAPDGFDARFSALRRRYVYRLCDGVTGPDPLVRRHVTHWRRALDADAMHAAGQRLLGEHDFASFCKRRDGATTVRSLLTLDTHRVGDRIDITVEADAFCHSMVRSLVGGLVAVGEGRYDLSWLGEILEARTRDPRVTVMPAHGLTLEAVVYPDADQLASRAATTRRRRDAP